MLKISFGVINSREIAMGLWFLVFLAWVIRSDRVRRALREVLTSALHRKIVIPVVLLVLYVLLVVRGLEAVGLWDHSLLKDTVIWFLFSGVVLFFSPVTGWDEKKPFRQVMREQLSLLLPLEFLINTYTFPLYIELLLVPALVFMGLVGIVAEYENNFEHARQFASSLQAIAGWVMIIFVLARFLGDLGTLRWFDTLRELALPPILTLCILPAAFLFLLFAHYETLFLRIGLTGNLERDVRWRAKWRLFQHLGLNLARIDEYSRNHALALNRIRSRSDLDELLPPSA